MTKSSVAATAVNLTPQRFVRTGHVRVVLCCFAVAFAIALLPYLIWSLVLGHFSFVYVADPDNQLYLQIASHAYFNHPWFISDPSRRAGLTQYPWLQFAPFVLLARLLELGPFGVNLLWRLWAAVGLAVGFYFVFWRYLKSRLAATACAVFALTDSGLLTAHPIVHQVSLLARIISGRTAAIIHSWPPIMGQWRIVDPAVGLPAVLAHLAAVSLARERPTHWRLAAAGVSFGILFYVYFYYWTAVSAALALAYLIDAAGRRVYFQTAAIGMLVGGPGLIHDYLLKSKFSMQAMQRASYFLPMPRLPGLMVPRTTIVLLPVLLVWLCRTRRIELTYLWTLGAAGLALNNVGAIIGLDLREGHWQYVWGPATEVLLLILLADWARKRFRWSPTAARIGLGALGFYAMMALFLEGFNVLRVQASREMLANYKTYSAQQMDSGAAKLIPHSTIAGDERYVDLAVITRDALPLYNYAVIMSPTISDHDWELQFALNQFLMGVDAHTFRLRARQFASTYQWGPWSYGEDGGRPALLTQMLSAYKEVAEAPSAFLNRFAVRYVALPTGDASPPGAGCTWSVVGQGPSWTVWERKQTS